MVKIKTYLIYLSFLSLVMGFFLVTPNRAYAFHGNKEKVVFVSGTYNNAPFTNTWTFTPQHSFEDMYVMLVESNGSYRFIFNFAEVDLDGYDYTGSPSGYFGDGRYFYINLGDASRVQNVVGLDIVHWIPPSSNLGDQWPPYSYLMNPENHTPDGADDLPTDENIGYIMNANKRSSLLYMNNAAQGNLYYGVSVNFDRLSSTGFDLTTCDEFRLSFQYERKTYGGIVTHNLNDSDYIPLPYIDHFAPFAYLTFENYALSGADKYLNLVDFIENYGDNVPFNSGISKVRFKVFACKDYRQSLPTYVTFDLWDKTVSVKQGDDGTPETNDANSGEGINPDEALDNADNNFNGGSNIDSNNIVSALKAFLSNLGTFPEIFKSLFSWLPSWVYQYFVACISLILIVYTLRIAFLLIG